MKIGKAKINGGGNNNKKYFKLAKGEGVVGVYRFLPPLGELADAGIWAKRYAVHYGYKNSKGKVRPFVSPEVKNFKTNMIEVEDEAKRRLDSLKAKKEEAKAAGNKEMVDKLNGLLFQYNMEVRYYMNAINLEGEIGLAKVPTKAKQLIDAELKVLEAKGIDALGVDNGRFFVITRTGTGNQTSYSVKIYKETINHPELGMVEKDKVHVLTDDIISRLSSETHQLDKLFKKPSADQVRQLVKETDLMSGISQNIDDLLGYKDNDQAVPSEEEETEEAVVAAKDEIDSLMAEVSKPVVAKPTPAPTPTPVVKTEVKIGKTTNTEPKQNNDAVSKMSTDEFLAFIDAK